MLQSSSQINLIRAINLWYYRGDRISTWHYDGHDNFLYLLAGTKVVYLLPPDHNDAVLQAKIVFSLDNNHSKGEMPK